MTWIRIGFTGPRAGMTKAHMIAVHRYLGNVLLINDNDPRVDGIEVHHGDCIGSDMQFHVIATVLGCRTIAHPPLNTSLRAYCPADLILPPKDYLARDRDIVAQTGELLATPRTLVSYQGSGTWTTIGYGLQALRPVKVFDPDTGLIRDGRSLVPALPGRP